METEKLELSHLAPYLPYGLQMAIPENYRFSGYRTDAKHSPLTGIQDEFIKLDNIGGFYPINDFKPLLLPLSELTTWMELSGVGEHNTIPIYELFKDEQILNIYQEHNLFLDQKMPSILIEKAKENHWGWDYEKWEKLFKWHFDVFGLIEKGLALNKLTALDKYLEEKK